MSQIVLTCPIDDLALETRTATEVAGVARGERVNVSHIHVQVASDATCANGHRWRLAGDLVLQRVRG